jgi:isopentenyl phosphate kinase
VTDERKVLSWDLHPLRTFLDQGLLPVVYGDVVVDRKLGGTILSTEDIFVHLAAHLRPQTILLAGEEPGVWANFPASTELLKEITPADRAHNLKGIQGAVDTDVTGGMSGKVHQMLTLIEKFPEITVQIFSGKNPDTVKKALLGGAPGTKLWSQPLSSNEPS